MVKWLSLWPLEERSNSSEAHPTSLQAFITDAHCHVLLLAQPTATEAPSDGWLSTLTQGTLNLVVPDPVVSSLFLFPSPPRKGMHHSPGSLCVLDFGR